jgi:hypothetical protein
LISKQNAKSNSWPIVVPPRNCSRFPKTLQLQATSTSTHFSRITTQQISLRARFGDALQDGSDDHGILKI